MKSIMKLLILTLLGIQCALAGGSISWEDMKSRIAKSDPELVKVIENSFMVNQSGGGVRLGPHFGERQGERISPYEFEAEEKKTRAQCVLVIEESQDYEFTGRFKFVKKSSEADNPEPEGAGQPATLHVVKPKGSDEQPESKESEELSEALVEWFENHLQKYPHALLVCTSKDFMVDEPGSDLYQRYYKEATVVQVFKGDSKVSRRLKFFLMIEGRPKLELDSKSPGELSFVFFDEMPEGELLLGTGDGFRFHPNLLKLAEATKAKSEAGTGQPANRTASKPEDSDKPQPESKGRSR